MKLIAVFFAAVSWFGCLYSCPSLADGWESLAPRDEIRPAFSRDGDTLQIAVENDKHGLMGSWQNTFAIQGGQHYRFEVRRKTTGVDLVRRAAIARIVWLDKNGKKTRRADPTFTTYYAGERPQAEPDFPAVEKRLADGWTLVSGTFVAPPSAVSARIELHLRWAPPKAKVVWSIPSLTKTSAPPPRQVKLASVHFQPKAGTTAAEKCKLFTPLIAKAADQGADLIVLPETLTYYHSGGSYADAAESIPGPSTEFFSKLAKQHDTYIVAGLIERDQHLIYNVAVLVGPDGLVGKYRKVTLPRGEIESGVMPGQEYPVFETRFGKVGMMVCYDGFFPEVARELSNRGAEVIAWPVWGCNPILGAARAWENHVYVVSSTYTDTSRNWTVSAVFGHDGKPLAKAENWGTIAIAKVDLNKPNYWHSLGDFRAQIQRHRPKVAPVP